MLSLIEETGEFYYKKRPELFYLIIFGLSLLFRLWGLGRESAWIDEAYSVHLSVNPVQEIFLGCINDQHPPLYYIILKFWLGNIFDISKARLLSALIGSLNVLQIIFIFRGIKILNWKTTIVTCLLISVSPMHVWYSQEARMYILLLFFVLLSIQTFILLLFFLDKNIPRSKNFLWILFVLFNILSIYTHYFSIFIILFELLFFIFYLYYKKLIIKKALLGTFSFFAIGLAFMPWVPVILNQALLHKLDWIEVPTLFTIATSINRLIIGPGVIFLPKGLNLLLTFTILLFFIYGFSKSLKNMTGSFTSILFLILWIFIPIFLISFLSIIYPIFQFKQLIIILVPILVTTVFLIIQVFKKKIAMLIICCLLGLNFLSSIYQNVSITKDDWRGLTYFIEQNYNSGDVIYFNTSASQLGFTLYKKTNIQIEGFPQEYDVIKGGWNGNNSNLEEEVKNLIIMKKEFKRIWYVQYYPDLWDPDRLIYSWLNNNMKTKSEHKFGSILLLLYE